MHLSLFVVSPTSFVVLHAAGVSWDEFLIIGVGVAVSTVVFVLTGRGGKRKGKDS